MIAEKFEANVIPKKPPNPALKMSIMQLNVFAAVLVNPVACAAIDISNVFNGSIQISKT